jgi:hypothetical protein
MRMVQPLPASVRPVNIVDMGLTIAANGSLQSPNLHDGYVVGLHLAGNDLAQVTLRDLHGQRFVLELAGLKRLRCDGFAEGNIISDLMFIRGAAPPNDVVRKLVGEPHPSAGEPYRQQFEKVIADYERKVIEGDLTFVEIVPSYGCEISALRGNPSHNR